MKRHPSIHPLSRDHHEGLLLCWNIGEARKKEAGEAREAALRAAFENFLREWRGWLPSHFLEEEKWLPRLLSDAALLRRLSQDHRQIASLAAQLASRSSAAVEEERLAEFASALHDHIRWEERVLFPAIEREADLKLLDEFAEAMRAMEASRPRSCSANPDVSKRDSR